MGNISYLRYLEMFITWYFLNFVNWILKKSPRFSIYLLTIFWSLVENIVGTFQLLKFVDFLFTLKQSLQWIYTTISKPYCISGLRLCLLLSLTDQLQIYRHDYAHEIELVLFRFCRTQIQHRTIRITLHLQKLVACSVFGLCVCPVCC